VQHAEIATQFAAAVAQPLHLVRGQLAVIGPGQAETAPGGEAPGDRGEGPLLQQHRQLIGEHSQPQQPGGLVEHSQALGHPLLQGFGVELSSHQFRSPFADAGDLLAQGLGTDAGQADQQAGCSAV